MSMFQWNVAKMEPGVQKGSPNAQTKKQEGVATANRACNKMF